MQDPVIYLLIPLNVSHVNAVTLCRNRPRNTSRISDKNNRKRCKRLCYQNCPDELKI